MTFRDPMPIPDWLTLLVLLCNPQETEQTTANMVPMMPFLAPYPAWAFCRASAQAVEAFDRLRAVPSLSEITRPLDGWIERTPAPSREEQRQMALAVQQQRRIGA